MQNTVDKAECKVTTLTHPPKCQQPCKRFFKSNSLLKVELLYFNKHVNQLRVRLMKPSISDHVGKPSLPKISIKPVLDQENNSKQIIYFNEVTVHIDTVHGTPARTLEKPERF